jgi:hypothetical protein
MAKLFEHYNVGDPSPKFLTILFGAVAYAWRVAHAPLTNLNDVGETDFGVQAGPYSAQLANNAQYQHHLYGFEVINIGTSLTLTIEGSHQPASSNGWHSVQTTHAPADRVRIRLSAINGGTPTVQNLTSNHKIL